MKKLIVIALALIVVSTIGFSQKNQKNNIRSEVMAYMKSNVFPVILEQQEIYLKNLSENERAEILNLKKERYSQSADNTKSNRYALNQEITRKVEEITSKYQELNTAYEQTINSHKKIWIKDIEAIRNKSDLSESAKGKSSDHLNRFFNKAETSTWMLLWDKDKAGNMQKNMHMKNSFSKKGGKNHMSHMANPEISSYINKNIIPVVSKERSLFDKKLTKKEKEIINAARDKIEVRKIMFKSWYASEDFVAGQRAKDSSFDNMRADMQKSMEEVRAIAKTHSNEIDESMKNIKSHAEQWKTDILALSNANNKKTEGFINKKMHRAQTPVFFLLFNPDKANDVDLFGLDKQSELKVTVYPNPAANFANITVLNAVGSNLKVTLYTKSGEFKKDLYNAVNQQNRLNLKIDTKELDNDIYIVKVNYQNNNISRKIVVKH